MPLIDGRYEVVTVHSGCGDDFGTNLYWCSVGSATWNNDGDTVFLTDPATHTTRQYMPPNHDVHRYPFGGKKVRNTPNQVGVTHRCLDKQPWPIRFERDSPFGFTTAPS